MEQRKEKEIKIKIRTFVACGFWAASLVGTLWDSVFTALGNKIAGITEEDNYGVVTDDR